MGRILCACAEGINRVAPRNGLAPPEQGGGGGGGRRWLWSRAAVL